jgi:hypothetical protein
MTAKKFPKTSHNPSEREPVRLAGGLALRGPALRDEGGPARRSLGERGPALQSLGQGGPVAASPQPPRLGQPQPEKKDTQKVIHRLRKAGRSAKKH